MIDPRNPDATFTIDESRSVPTAVVRGKDLPMADLSAVYDSAFGALFPALAEQGIAPAGAALGVYTRFSDDWSRCDLEVGVPLHEPLPGTITVAVPGGRDIEIVPSELPSGKVASTLYTGPYDGLGDAWKSFTDALAAAGHTVAMPCWEVYLTDPGADVDPAELRTGLNTAVE